jgi:hypothetical protein
MNTPTPHYDLLPLVWWENPWIVGSIITLLVLGPLAACITWRMMYIRAKVTIDPLDQLFLNLQALQKSLRSEQCTTQQAYYELMRMFREYARLHCKIYNISHTDDEFTHSLKNTSIPVPDNFLDIVSKVGQEAYQVKFANIIFPPEHIQNYLQDFILFLEQEKNKIIILPEK